MLDTKKKRQIFYCTGWFCELSTLFSLSKNGVHRSKVEGRVCVLDSNVVSSLRRIQDNSDVVSLENGATIVTLANFAGPNAAELLASVKHSTQNHNREK